MIAGGTRTRLAADPGSNPERRRYRPGGSGRDRYQAALSVHRLRVPRLTILALEHLVEIGLVVSMSTARTISSCGGCLSPPVTEMSQVG